MIGIGGIILFKILYKNKDFGVDHYSYIEDDNSCRFFAYIGVYFIIGIAILMITTQIFDIVTCLTFPEKIIIEELKTIYSSMNN